MSSLYSGHLATLHAFGCSAALGKGLGFLSIAAKQRGFLLVEGLLEELLERVRCIYEISTFLRKKDNRAQIQVMPVKLALLLCISVTKWFVMVAVWHTVSRVSDPDEELEALSRTLAVTVPCVLCAGAWCNEGRVLSKICPSENAVIIRSRDGCLEKTS